MLLSQRYILNTKVNKLGVNEFVSPPKLLEPNDQKYLKNLLKNKFTEQENSHYVTWMVSNCHSTTGSIARLEYARKLVAAGLKLDGFGKCFSEKEDPEGHFQHVRGVSRHQNDTQSYLNSVDGNRS